MPLRIPLVVTLVASLSMLGLQSAQAADRDAMIVGAIAGAVIGGVIASHSQQKPHYQHAPSHRHHRKPVAYYPARPVYYSPRPVYYQAAPLYYRAKPHKHRYVYKKPGRHPVYYERRR